MAIARKTSATRPGRRWASLGARLRELRTKSGRSLKEVSARSGIARSTLYKVENLGMSLTYDNLIRLSEGLGVAIEELFEDEDAQRRRAPAAGWRAVGGFADGLLVSTANYDYTYICNDLRHKHMLPMLGVIKARSLEEFGPMVSHPGEEFSYVLRGTMEVHTDIYAPVRLTEGRYIYLDSTTPHAYVSVGEIDALVLCVCSSPGTDLAESLPRLLAEADANRAEVLVAENEPTVSSTNSGVHASSARASDSPHSSARERLRGGRPRSSKRLR